MNAISEEDLGFMRRCFELAERGRCNARPNPVVGALVVKDNAVIAEGWHAGPGEDHAEIQALKAAQGKARGATLYVSLEPCCHHGRTAPCCDAVIASGISRLVYGMIDPNPLVSGRGAEKIKSVGLEVQGPVMENEARALNPGFSKRMRHKLPLVRCKLAMSLDGRTAMASGESKWISGAEARLEVQELRARSCAVMTGIGTLLQDDPGLHVREKAIQCPQPLRVIVDSRLRTPAQAKTLGLEGEVLLATAVAAPDMLAAKAKEYGRGNLRLESFPDAKGQVDLRRLLQFLAEARECNEVLLESGATLAGAMLQEGLVDELILYLAPHLLGDGARPLLRLPGLERLSDRRELEILDVAMAGKDCRIRSRPIKAAP